MYLIFINVSLCFKTIVKLLLTYEYVLSSTIFKLFKKIDILLFMYIFLTVFFRSYPKIVLIILA